MFAHTATAAAAAAAATVAAAAAAAGAAAVAAAAAAAAATRLQLAELVLGVDQADVQEDVPMSEKHTQSHTHHARHVTVLPV